VRLAVSALILAASLAVWAAPVAAEVARPVIAVAPDQGSCLAPPEEMRRRHMDMLKHQRDRTLRDGERGARISLNGCIACHAGKESGSVAASRQDFCESCHAYVAVKLDCFECHQPKSGGLATGEKP
jgi:hypothetical protein